MDWQASSRPAKQDARRYQLERQPRAKTSLWMPAAECLDIRLALEIGLLDLDSQVIAVEADEAIYAQMVETLGQLGFRLPPKTLNQPLETVELPAKVDFAYLDFCGTLRGEYLGWMANELAPKLAAAAGVSVTCSFSVRNSHFLRHCRNAYVMRHRAVHEEFSNSHDYHNYRQQWNNYTEYEPFEVPALLLKSAFRRHDFIMRRPWPYRDGTPMIAWALRDFHDDRRPYYPAISRIMADFPKGETPPPPSSPQTPSLRSLAALKAHATRRANGWVHPATRRRLAEEARGAR